MSSAKVTDKKTTELLWSSEIFSISQREAYPFLLKQGWISYIKPNKGIKFKEFKELKKKVLSYSKVKYFKI